MRAVLLAVKDALWSNLPPIDIYNYIGHVGEGLLQARGAGGAGWRNLWGRGRGEGEIGRAHV